MIYLFHGPDELARTEALARHKAQIPPDLADLNLAVLEGKKLKLDQLISACEAFPFIAERRLVVVNDLLKHLKAGKERDEMRAYLERVPATCDLILVEQEDIDKRNGIFTWLKKVDGKQSRVEEFTPREGAALLRWLGERAQALHVVLEPPAAQKLVEYVGNESRALVNELAKLASYVGTGGRITPREVETLVEDGQEQNLFAFIDELSQRRRGPALASVRHLLNDGQAAQYILFMVARQLRILLMVKELAGKRMRPDDMAAHLGQRPFVVRKAVDQSRAFTDDELLMLHDRLVQYDQMSKTGQIEAEAALELLVAEMCG